MAGPALNSNMEENLCENLKKFLVEFDYPLAKSMNEDELAEVFSHRNKAFLISWALKVYDEGIIMRAEQANDKTYLGSIMVNLGFLNECEKMGFMEDKIKPTRQMEILNFFFNFIRTSKKPPQGTLKVTLDDIFYLREQNVSFFPEYQSHFNLIESEKSDKEENTENEDSNESSTLVVIEEKSCVDLDDLVNELKTLFGRMDLMRNKIELADNGRNDVWKFHDEFGKKLSRCRILLQQFYEYAEACNLIDKFLKEVPEDVNTVVINENYVNYLATIEKQLSNVILTVTNQNY